LNIEHQIHHFLKIRWWIWAPFGKNSKKQKKEGKRQIERFLIKVAISNQIRSTKFEIALFQTNPKFECSNVQKIFKIFICELLRPQAFVLNFVFWSFEFVSNFEIRISDF